jgi:hypothetical protein
MLIATIALVGIGSLGVIVTLLKAIHEHGLKSGELSSALESNTTATEHLTTTVEHMNTVMRTMK